MESWNLKKKKVKKEEWNKKKERVELALCLIPQMIVFSIRADTLNPTWIDH